MFIHTSLQPPRICLGNNDTSLAALTLANGDRQLFFQDSTGLLRRLIRTASNGQWVTSADQNLSFNSNPRSYTPLAVTVNDITQIELYYVSENEFLETCVFDTSVWARDRRFGETYSTAVHTRSLSISLIGGAEGVLPTRNSTTNSALLYYKNSTGKVSLLLHRINYTWSSPSTFGVEELRLSQWVDITSQESRSLPYEFHNTPGEPFSNTLYESDTYNAIYSSPFTSGANFATWSVGTLFYSPSTAAANGTIISGDFIAFAGCMFGPTGPGNFSAASLATPENYTSIRQSDIAMFGTEYAMLVNGTQSGVLYGTPTDLLPDNAFPFTRLASVTLANQSVTFLYHQINGTTFAEEQWDNSLKTWLPTKYIIVSFT